MSTLRNTNVKFCLRGPARILACSFSVPKEAFGVRKGIEEASGHILGTNYGTAAIRMPL